MKYTEHYQLNQWDAADRVLREDFNRDNAKVDAALAKCASDHVCSRLLHTVVPSDTPRFDLDVSTLDLTAFQELILYSEAFVYKRYDYTYLRCNGQSNGYFNGDTEYTRLADISCSYTGGAYSRTSLILTQNAIYAAGNGGNWENQKYLSRQSGESIACQLSPEALTTLNIVVFNGNDPAQLKAGSSFTLYGLRR